MHNSRWALMAALSLMSIALAACGDTSANTAGRSARVDTVVICTAQEPPSLYRIESADPGTVQALTPADPQGWRPDRAFGYETMMLEGGEFPTLENGGAQLRGAGEDAVLIVTFRFRQDITWSDGEPFTVDDILFTRQVILDAQSGAAARGLLAQQTFEKVDDFTLKVTYAPGVGDPLYYLPPLSTANGLAAPLPEHILGNMRPAEIRRSDYARLPNPVLGPYEYVEWEPGSHITLRAVENWWGGRAPITHVVFRFVRASDSILAMIESGECDLATSDAFQITQRPQIEQSAAQGSVAYEAVPSATWERIDMNVFPTAEPGREVIPYFADVRVRQAIAYGTNRQQMADEILSGRVDVMNSTLPPGHPAWNPETARLYPYDPQRADALLADAGWSDRDGDGIREAVRDLAGEYSCGRGAWSIPAGTPFEVKLQVSGGDALREQVVRQFQDDMAALGIRISIDLLPGAPRYTANLENARTFQMGAAAESGLDPGAWLGYGGVNMIRTPGGEVINAYDLWQQRGDALSASGLTYEQLAFGRPVERGEDAPADSLSFLADRLPEGYRIVQLQGSSVTGWCDPQAAQRLFEGGQAWDAEARSAAYREFQMIFAQQVPSLPLFQHIEVYVWTANLCGPDLGPASMSAATWNVASWRFTPPGTQCAGG